MTVWNVHHGDIFDVQADVLICSANVFLTLSGGVGGELLRRYGAAMQSPLNDYLARRGSRHVQRGTVVAVSGDATPYTGILHAVAVDGMYESTPSIVTATSLEAFRQASEIGAKTVVLPALATGYGHLSIDGFVEGIVAAAGCQVPLEQVTVALLDNQLARQLRSSLT